MNSIKTIACCLYSVFFFNAWCSYSQELQETLSKGNRSILVVLAHPDDDVTIGPLLAHYAQKGADVYLALATSGQEGVTDHAGIPAGDELGRIREEESRCACEIYGIHEPKFFGEWDGKFSGFAEHWEMRMRFRESLKSIIGDTKAEIIITFGPSGATGHPDHRMISSLVTEFLENQSRSELPSFEKLYHISLPAGNKALFGAAGTVQEEYITTIIDTRDGLDRAAQAASCYKSQHQLFATQAINTYIGDHLEGKTYLRLVLSRKEKSSEIGNDL